MDQSIDGYVFLPPTAELSATPIFTKRWNISINLTEKKQKTENSPFIIIFFLTFQNNRVFIKMCRTVFIYPKTNVDSVRVWTNCAH